MSSSTVSTGEAPHPDSPLRMAVVGLGPIGRLHAAAISRFPEARLGAVCDLNANTFKDFSPVACDRDLPKLLREQAIDAVVVATPDDQHRAAVLQSLEAGCHVFCEKPLATSLMDARAMVEASHGFHRNLAVNFNRRWGWGYSQTKRWIDEDVIGWPQQLIIQVTDRYPNLGLQQDPFAMLTTLLVHHFDLGRWLLGDFVNVSATADRDSSGFISRMAITLCTAAGQQAMITSAYRTNQVRTHEVAHLIGTQGVVCVNDVTRDARRFHLDPDQVTISSPPLFDYEAGFEATLSRHLFDFLTKLREGRPPAATGHDGYRAMQIAEAARRSMESNHWESCNEASS